MYLIKLKNSDGTQSYMTNFSEYMNGPSANMITFPSRDEAEIWAQNMELSNYEVVNLNEGRTGDLENLMG